MGLLIVLMLGLFQSALFFLSIFIARNTRYNPRRHFNRYYNHALNGPSDQNNQDNMNANDEQQDRDDLDLHIDPNSYHANAAPFPTAGYSKMKPEQEAYIPEDLPYDPRSSKDSRPSNTGWN